MLTEIQQCFENCKQELQELARYDRLLAIAAARSKSPDQVAEIVGDMAVLVESYQAHVNFAMDLIQSELTELQIILQKQAQSREKTSRLENPSELN